MTDTLFPSNSFLHFSDGLTGYRLSCVLMLIEEVALFDIIDEQGATSEHICARIGWDRHYGRRFLDCLQRLGLLEFDGALYQPSRFSSMFLCRSGVSFQGKTLQFEQKLHAAWQNLGSTLRAGKRLLTAGDKTEAELQQALALYLGSMDEAAAIRSEELWQALGPLPEQGCILDIGAGSGAYLATFLHRYPGWSAIYCDLPMVVDSSCHHRLDPYSSRITWCRANLLSDAPSPLDDIEPGSCQLVLLSNLIHCQGREETSGLLQRVAQKTSPEGRLLIHDFFSDCGWRGALYDLHMMLNTYNGRTYRVEECVDMAGKSCFCCHTSHTLTSGSTLLIFARSESMLCFPGP